MNTVLSRRTTARPAALAAVFAALLAALLLLGAPAQAHDTLLASDPADGATLDGSVGRARPHVAGVTASNRPR